MQSFFQFLQYSLFSHVTAIHDPNTNTTLFESNAINNYLITTYDTAHTLT